MTNPTERMLLADINQISEEYFKLSQELAEISERKGMEWLRLRKETKTNAEADRTWDATADGRRESYLVIYLKGVEKLRAARILEYKSNLGLL